MYKIKSKTLKNNTNFVDKVNSKINILKNKIKTKKEKLKNWKIIKDELYIFLNDNKLSQYYSILIDNKVNTLHKLYKYNNDVLKKLGLNFAHILKLKKLLSPLFPVNVYEEIKAIEIEPIKIEPIKIDQSVEPIILEKEKIIEKSISPKNTFKSVIYYCYNCFNKILDDKYIKNQNYKNQYFCSKSCLNNIIFQNIKKCCFINCHEIFQKNSGHMNNCKWYCSEVCISLDIKNTNNSKELDKIDKEIDLDFEL